MEFLDSLLEDIVEVAILLFEYTGVIIIIITGIQGIIAYVRRDPNTRLNLAKGLAMGLEFKMGSEILRTVVAREFSDILMVGAVIVLRAALTILIHWEIRNEEKENEEKEEKQEQEGSEKHLRADK